MRCKAPAALNKLLRSRFSRCYCHSHEGSSHLQKQVAHVEGNDQMIKDVGSLWREFDKESTSCIRPTFVSEL